MDNHERGAQRAKLLLAGLAVLVLGALGAGGIAAYSLIDEDSSRTPAAGATGTGATKPSGSASAGGGAEMTPERAKKVSLDAPTGQEGGASTGFPTAPAVRSPRSSTSGRSTPGWTTRRPASNSRS